MGESLGVLLGGAGVPAALSISVGTVAALVIATVVQMIFGELYPKNLAIANPEPRVEPVHDVDITATAGDLDRIVADSRDSGDLPQDLSMLIDRILDFPERDIEHAMIPRSQVGTVTPDTTVGQVRTLMAEAHTRYPVVSDTEEPLGVVQLTDLLNATVPHDAAVTTVMRPPLVLPTLMSLPDALEQLMRSRNQLACVIDEYGGFTGVITIEDLAEELVGELTDEHDDEAPPTIEAEQDATWRMSGGVHIDEVERAIGHLLPEGDYETLSGLLIAARGKLPVVGEMVTVVLPGEPRDLVLHEPVRRRLEVEVLDVARHVPSELLVQLREVEPDHAEAEAPADDAVPVDTNRARRRPDDGSAVRDPGPVFASWAVPQGIAGGTAFALSLLFVTFLHLVVGEMAPKSWAIAHPETSAKLIGLPARGFVWCVRPLLSWVNEVANRLVAASGVTPVERAAVGGQDADTIRHLVEHSAAAGALDASFRTQLSGVLELEKLTVKSLIAPGTTPTAVPGSATMADLQVAADRSQHLRILVEAARGGAPGVVHVRDTLLEPPQRRVRELARPAFQLDAATPVNEALARIRSAGEQLAVVMEDGRFIGVITLSDVMRIVLPAYTPPAK